MRPQSSATQRPSLSEQTSQGTEEVHGDTHETHATAQGPSETTAYLPTCAPNLNYSPRSRAHPTRQNQARRDAPRRTQLPEPQDGRGRWITGRVRSETTSGTMEGSTQTEIRSQGKLLLDKEAGKEMRSTLSPQHHQGPSHGQPHSSDIRIPEAQAKSS